MSAQKFYEIPVGNKDSNNAAVVIIGAGISGICTAIDLIRRNNCRNFVIIEKGNGFGGVWRDNVYPGCGCDIKSQLYSFSFEQSSTWTHEHASQEEFLTYLLGVTDKWGLSRHARFNTMVEEARWDEHDNKWKTTVRVTGGKEAEFRQQYTISSDFLVSAVGLLNYPSYPDIPGRENYTGRLMHSARWDLDCNWEGKRVAVVGNGSSSIQILPEIADKASQIVVFQRSPNWVLPKSDAPITGLRKLARKLALTRSRIRGDEMTLRESLFTGLFDDSSPISELIRTMSKDLMESQLKDKPDLWPKLTPNFPPGCKRILLSDDYYSTLNRNNVHLETRSIEKFTSDGIQVRDEEEQTFDLVILATGFRTLDFMYPIKITGRGGRSLEDIWRSGAHAYKGVTVESLPNFGMLYGPNTSVTHNSIILMIEAQSRYISVLVKHVLQARQEGKLLSFSPKASVVERYNSRIQTALQSSSFANPNCSSWFKNQDGKVITAYSGPVIQYQQELSEIEWADFDMQGSASEGLEGRRLYVGRVVEETLLSYPTLAMLSLGIGSLAAFFLSKSRPVLWGSIHKA